MAASPSIKAPKSKKAKRATPATPALPSPCPAPDTTTTDMSSTPAPSASTPSSDTTSSATPSADLSAAPTCSAAMSSLPTGQNVVIEQQNNLMRATDAHPAIARRGGSYNDADESPLHANPELYTFRFDSLCTPRMTSDDLYTTKIAPIVRAAAEGYNATVFAYGQTGSGKTHTMSGAPDEPGIIPRAVEEIFDQIECNTEREYLLRVSYLEIYNESLKDLLAAIPSKGTSLPTKDVPRKSMAPRPSSPTKGGFTPSPSSNAIRIVEDQAKGRIVLTGIREEIVTSPEDVLRLLEDGQRMRHVGATDWNERSSRSHCVFQITIESRGRAPEGDTSVPSIGSRAAAAETRISMLNLIDLAGSERAATDQARRKEGAFINKSLLTLGTVISKLGEVEDGGDVHIPYRDSKLTRLLQTSLSGNARVAVICTVSPDERHATESLSTLKFGKRCRMVKTSAKRGVVMDDRALLLKYRAELEMLRAQLAAQGQRNTSLKVDAQPDEELTAMQQKKDDLRSQITHLTTLFLTSQSVSAKREAFTSPPRVRRGRLTDFPTPSVEHTVRSTAPPLPASDTFASEREMAHLRRAMVEAESKALMAQEEAAHAKATEASALEQLEETQQRLSAAREELSHALDGAARARSEAEDALTAAKDEAAQAVLRAQAEAEKALNEAQAEGARLVSEAQRDAAERLEAISQESSSASIARDEAHRALVQAKTEGEASILTAKEEAKRTIDAVQQDVEVTLQKAKEESSKAIQQAKSEAGDSLASVQGELEALQLKLSETKKDAADAVEREMKARADLSHLTTEAESLRSEAASLRFELAQIRTSLEQAEAARVAAQDEAGESLRAYERARSECGALSQREEVLQSQMEEVHKSLTSARGEASQLKHAHELTGTKYETLAAREATLQAELEEMRQTLTVAQAHADEAKSDRERQEVEHESLARREEALQRELQEVLKTLALVQADTEELKQAHERTGVERDALTERQVTLQNELEEMHQALVATQADAEDARNDASRLTELAMSAHEALKSERQSNEEANQFATKEQERILSLALQSREQTDKEKSDALEKLKLSQMQVKQALDAQARAEETLSKMQEDYGKAQENLAEAKKMHKEMELMVSSLVLEVNQLRPLVPSPDQRQETEALAQRLQQSLASLEEERILRQGTQECLARAQQGHLDIAAELDEARVEADKLSDEVACLNAELAGERQGRRDSSARVEQLSRDLNVSEVEREKLAARVKELENLLYLRRQEADPGMAEALRDANTQVDDLTCSVSEQQVVISELEGAVDTWKGKLKSQHDLIIRLISASSGGDQETFDAIRRVIAPTPQMKVEALFPAQEPQSPSAQRTPVKSPAATSRGTTPSRRPQPAGTHWLYTQPEPLPLHPNSEAGRKVRPRKTIEKDLALLRQSPHVGGKREVFVRGTTPQRSASPPPSQRANTSLSFRGSVSPTGVRSKTPSKLPGFATENSPSPSPLAGRRLP